MLLYQNHLTGHLEPGNLPSGPNLQWLLLHSNQIRWLLIPLSWAVWWMHLAVGPCSIWAQWSSLPQTFKELCLIKIESGAICKPFRCWFGSWLQWHTKYRWNNEQKSCAVASPVFGIQFQLPFWHGNTALCTVQFHTPMTSQLLTVTEHNFCNQIPHGFCYLEALRGFLLNSMRVSGMQASRVHSDWTVQCCRNYSSLLWSFE